MKFEIKHNLDGHVLFSLETGSLRLCVEAAVNRGADLVGANLGGANLRGADLGGANLRDAILRGAHLGDADLGGANLRGADLGGANLRDADLGGANLRDAILRGADLRDADLGGANLRGAILGGADLGGANLGGVILGGADLGGADLGGANLRGAILRGNRPIMQIGPIGSRGDYLLSYLTDKGVILKAGCFSGTIDQFREKSKNTHNGNLHADEYESALMLIEKHAALWVVEVKQDGKP